jgi:hypothetical protein
VKPDVLIAVFAVVVSIFGLALSGFIAWRQRELTEELAWRQEVGVAQWRRDLRDWASEAIDILSEAMYACDDMPDATPAHFRQYLHQLWAHIDRGRFFLPNQRPEAREDPVIAYRGYRHRALDPLWAAGNVLENRIPASLEDDVDDVVRYRHQVLEELQREFVSNISAILAPESHNQEIASLIQKSEKRLQKSEEQRQKSEQVQIALRGEDTPRGDRLLLLDVVPRVIERQKEKEKRQKSRQANE